jgi:glucokinase
MKEPEPSVWIGLDVGGTKVEALVVDHTLAVRGRVVVPTDTSTQERAVDSIIESVQQVMAQAQVSPEQVYAAGLGIPGQVEGGMVNMAVNLNLTACPLGDILLEKTGVPFVLENDMRAATVGAYRYFSRRETVRSVTYMGIGTGVAAGIILNGELYRGMHGLAGEIGHLIMEPGGPRCNCGGQGCLETLASGTALGRLAREAVASGKNTLLKDFEPLTGESVFAAAGLGDPVAASILRYSCSYLARAIQVMLMMCDVDIVILGGGVAKQGEAFLQPLLVELAALRRGSPFLESMLADNKIRLSPADYNAGAWGAIYLASQQVEKYEK